MLLKRRSRAPHRDTRCVRRAHPCRFVWPALRPVAGFGGARACTLLAPSVGMPLSPRPGLKITPRIDKSSAPLAGIGILVVEDDPDARRLACVALEAWGSVVIGVGSAREALQTFQAVIPA